MEPIKDRLYLKKVINSYVLHRVKDGILTIEGDSEFVIGGIEPFYKLSKQNCDSLFGVVDVEKLAKRHHILQYIDAYNPDIEPYVVADYTAGFNKAMELNRFTLEDIKRAISFGQGMDLWKEEEQIGKFIQSRQQPKEIEVEMETCSMNPLDLDCDEIIERPKLDSDGCLILKKAR
jgi:hypothetical protein